MCGIASYRTTALELFCFAGVLPFPLDYGDPGCVGVNVDGDVHEDLSPTYSEFFSGLVLNVAVHLF